jgi:hypothetical protein
MQLVEIYNIGKPNISYEKHLATLSTMDINWLPTMSNFANFDDPNF